MADTAVTFQFADGEYRFWLPLPQVVELERKTGSSILAIEERLRAAIGAEGPQEDPTFVFLGGGTAAVADVRETLRLALQGGGGGLVDGQEVEVGPILARQLVDAYVYPARPLAEGVVQAWRVLHAAIHGIQLASKKKERGRRGRGEQPREPFRKGQLIANCGQLGLDWRQTDLSDYMESLEAWNEAHDPEAGKTKEASPELRRFLSAHTRGGNADTAKG